MRRRGGGLRVIDERALRWYCAECREWAVCDDHDLCVACRGGHQL